jgi:hypothetical protein
MGYVRSQMRIALYPFAPPSVLPDISPSRGEIGWHRGLRLTFGIVEKGSQGCGRLISPLEGEMSGRTEGVRRSRRREGVHRNNELQANPPPTLDQASRPLACPAEPSCASGVRA